MSSPSVAVLLAHNSDYNFGMYSVDFAAKLFFNRINCPCDLFVPFFSPRQVLLPYGKVRVHAYRSSRQLEKYRVVIVWGDFTTHPMYGLQDYPMRRVLRHQVGTVNWCLRSSVNAAFGLNYTCDFDEWKNLYLFAGMGQKPRSLFSIGQSFQSLADAEDGCDMKMLQNLYARFDAIFPRDSASLLELHRLPSLSSRQVLPGMDCAFLLYMNGRERGRRNDARKLRIGYHFKRSGLKNFDKVLSRLKEFDVELVEINGWLSSRCIRQHHYFEKTIETLRTCDLVISDTYHLLINSLGVGTIVIGLGIKECQQDSTVGDYKKRILFLDLGAPELYIECSEAWMDEGEINSIIKTMVSLMEKGFDHDVLKSIKEVSRKFSNNIESKIRSALIK